MRKNEHEYSLENHLTENLLSELNPLFDGIIPEKANDISNNLDNTLVLTEGGKDIKYEVVNIFAYGDDLFVVLLPAYMQGSFSPKDFVIKKVEDNPYENYIDDYSDEYDNKSIDELLEELKNDFEAGFTFPDLDDNDEG